MNCRHCGPVLTPEESGWANDGMCDRCCCALEDKADAKREEGE
jgi:hypothetical protein